MVGIEIMMQVGKNHYFYKWSQAWYLIALPQKDLKGVLYSVSRERNNVFSATSNIYKHWWLGVFYLSTEITIQLEKKWRCLLVFRTHPGTDKVPKHLYLKFNYNCRLNCIKKPWKNIMKQHVKCDICLENLHSINNKTEEHSNYLFFFFFLLSL